MTQNYKYAWGCYTSFGLMRHHFCKQTRKAIYEGVNNSKPVLAPTDLD